MEAEEDVGNEAEKEGAGEEEDARNEEEKEGAEEADRTTPEGSAGGRATATVTAAADLQEARAAAQEQVVSPQMDTWPAIAESFQRFLAVAEGCLEKLPSKGPDIRHAAAKLLSSAHDSGLPPEDRGFELWHACCVCCAWALQSLQSRNAGLCLHVAACHIQRVPREAASRLFAHWLRRRPCKAQRM